MSKKMSVKIKALEQAVEYWKWMVDTGEIHKGKYSNPWRHDCALCDIAHSPDEGCPDCLMEWGGIKRGENDGYPRCTHPGSPYRAYSDERSASTVEGMYEALKARLDELKEGETPYKDCNPVIAASLKKGQHIKCLVWDGHEKHTEVVIAYREGKNHPYVDRSTVPWVHAEPVQEKKVKPEVKSAPEIMQILVEAGYKVDGDGDWISPNSGTCFVTSMWEFCGKVKSESCWNWLPEWLEEVSELKSNAEFTEIPEAGGIKVGDCVRVIDNGKAYTTYTELAEFMELDDWDFGNDPCQGVIFKVKSMCKDTCGSRTYLGLTLDGKDFMIGLSGVEKL